MWKVMNFVYGPQWMPVELPWFPPETDVPFPDARAVDGDVVAVGGNLSPGMLLSAYRRGIFPWFSENEPLLWWSLNPRFVLFPERVHISKSLRKRIRRNPFRLSVDEDFASVIQLCSDSIRPGQDGTWITREMVKAYNALHRLGYAHSVEARIGERLVGGLYGVAIGGCFYGESMFAHEPDASKVAFAALCGFLTDKGYGLIDCQQHTSYLAGFGAVDMRRERFLEILAIELDKDIPVGRWNTSCTGFPESGLWNRLRESAAP